MLQIAMVGVWMVCRGPRGLQSDVGDYNTGAVFSGRFGLHKCDVWPVTITSLTAETTAVSHFAAF